MGDDLPPSRSTESLERLNISLYSAASFSHSDDSFVKERDVAVPQEDISAELIPKESRKFLRDHESVLSYLNKMILSLTAQLPRILSKKFSSVLDLRTQSAIRTFLLHAQTTWGHQAPWPSIFFHYRLMCEKILSSPQRSAIMTLCKDHKHLFWSETNFDELLASLYSYLDHSPYDPCNIFIGVGVRNEYAEKCIAYVDQESPPVLGQLVLNFRYDCNPPTYIVSRWVGESIDEFSTKYVVLRTNPLSDHESKHSLDFVRILPTSDCFFLSDIESIPKGHTGIDCHHPSHSILVDPFGDFLQNMEQHTNEALYQFYVDHGVDPKFLQMSIDLHQRLLNQTTQRLSVSLGEDFGKCWMRIDELNRRLRAVSTTEQLPSNLGDDDSVGEGNVVEYRLLNVVRQKVSSDLKVWRTSDHCPRLFIDEHLSERIYYLLKNLARWSEHKLEVVRELFLRLNHEFVNQTQWVIDGGFKVGFGEWWDDVKLNQIHELVKRRDPWIRALGKNFFDKKTMTIEDVISDLRSIVSLLPLSLELTLKMTSSIQGFNSSFPPPSSSSPSSSSSTSPTPSFFLPSSPSIFASEDSRTSPLSSSPPILISKKSDSNIAPSSSSSSFNSSPTPSSPLTPSSSLHSLFRFTNRSSSSSSPTVFSLSPTRRMTSPFSFHMPFKHSSSHETSPTLASISAISPRPPSINTRPSPRRSSRPSLAPSPIAQSGPSPFPTSSSLSPLFLPVSLSHSKSVSQIHSSSSSQIIGNQSPPLWRSPTSKLHDSPGGSSVSPRSSPAQSPIQSPTQSPIHSPVQSPTQSPSHLSTSTESHATSIELKRKSASKKQKKHSLSLKKGRTSRSTLQTPIKPKKRKSSRSVGIFKGKRKEEEKEGGEEREEREGEHREKKEEEEEKEGEKEEEEKKKRNKPKSQLELNKMLIEDEEDEEDEEEEEEKKVKLLVYDLHSTITNKLSEMEEQILDVLIPAIPPDIDMNDCQQIAELIEQIEKGRNWRRQIGIPPGAVGKLLQDILLIRQIKKDKIFAWEPHKDVLKLRPYVEDNLDEEEDNSVARPLLSPRSHLHRMISPRSNRPKIQVLIQFEGPHMTMAELSRRETLKLGNSFEHEASNVLHFQDHHLTISILEEIVREITEMKDYPDKKDHNSLTASDLRFCANVLLGIHGRPDDVFVTILKREILRPDPLFRVTPNIGHWVLDPLMLSPMRKLKRLASDLLNLGRLYFGKPRGLARKLAENAPFKERLHLELISSVDNLFQVEEFPDLICVLLYHAVTVGQSLEKPENPSYYFESLFGVVYVSRLLINYPCLSSFVTKLRTGGTVKDKNQEISNLLNGVIEARKGMFDGFANHLFEKGRDLWLGKGEGPSSEWVVLDTFRSCWAQNLQQLFEKIRCDPAINRDTKVLMINLKQPLKKGVFF